MSFHGKVHTDDFAETIKKPDKKEFFLRNFEKKYYIYFKNFDYYCILIIYNKIAKDQYFALKLPIQFIKKFKYNSLNELLQKIILKIGIRQISEQFTGPIMPGMHKTKQVLVINPKTVKESWFFGCQDSKSAIVFSMFGINVHKYQVLLKKYKLDG